MLLLYYETTLLDGSNPTPKGTNKFFLFTLHHISHSIQKQQILTPYTHKCFNPAWNHYQPAFQHSIQISSHHSISSQLLQTSNHPHPQPEYKEPPIQIQLQPCKLNTYYSMCVCQYFNRNMMEQINQVILQESSFEKTKIFTSQMGQMHSGCPQSCPKSLQM